MLHWNNNSGQKSRSTSLIALLVFGLIFGFAINYFSHQQANAIVSVCGNEALELFEECDDGNTVNGDGCSSFCLTEIDTIPTSVCGNGVVQSEEECDDGNSTDGDGCSTECTLEP